MIVVNGLIISSYGYFIIMYLFLLKCFLVLLVILSELFLILYFKIVIKM